VISFLFKINIENMEKSVEHLDVSINANNIKDGALQVVRHIRPKWSKTNIEFQVFTDGITNRLIGCYYDNNFDDMVLIRVYGEKTELFIDRKVEMRNMRTMHKSGLIPPLYCTFNNGICYGYSPGVVLDEKMVRDPIISRNISEMMARMHTLKPIIHSSNGIDDGIDDGISECQENSSSPKPCLFRGLRKFLNLIPLSFNEPQQEIRFKLNSRIL
jgi:ethanolamine kinase